MCVLVTITIHTRFHEPFELYGSWGSKLAVAVRGTLGVRAVKALSSFRFGFSPGSAALRLAHQDHTASDNSINRTE